MKPTKIQPDGAVVAITGAARGIGLATAKRFAAAGARVAIGDLDPDDAQTAASEVGHGAIGLTLDVTALDSYAAFIAAIEAALGPVDVLVNNAGIMPAGPFLEQSAAIADAQIDVNLRGPVHGMRLVLPGMIRRRRGHVVNVASMAGKVHVPGLAVYVATKHAVVGLSASVRDELDGTGVTLTTILPTTVKTELSSGLDHSMTFPVEPEDVAAAIFASLDSRAPELAVPRWMAGYGMAMTLTPNWLMHRVRKLMNGWRLTDKSGVDATVRDAYDQRLQRDNVRADERERVG